jgi:hypothetical protein
MALEQKATSPRAAALHREPGRELPGAARSTRGDRVRRSMPGAGAVVSAILMVLLQSPLALAAPPGRRAAPKAKPAASAKVSAAPNATGGVPSAAPRVSGAPAAVGSERVGTVVGAPASEVVKTEEATAGVKTYTFGAQEVEGRLRSPQILYFMRRVRAEFDPQPLGHRSFLLELRDTRRHPALQ